jgi:hypothetical protein
MIKSGVERTSANERKGSEIGRKTEKTTNCAMLAIQAKWFYSQETQQE